MESPSRSTIKYPSQGLQEGQVLCTAVRPVGTNNSKRPIPNPKAQGSDPLVHRSELQHMAAELGSYKASPHQLPPAHPGQLQSSGGSSPSQGAGFQSPSYAWRDWVVEAPATTATQTTLHRPLMDLPAGGEPTGRRAHVAIFGLSPAGSRGQRPGHQALACEPLTPGLAPGTKDAEPVVGKEIQVTVCNEEKVVCGVTKHTTCADMIQALLDDHKSVPESKRLLHGEPKDFCLVERWKGFERALPPLTRILRLWYAWGDQRPFIQFILVKTSDFVPQPTKKVGKSKGAKPKHGRPQYPQSLPAERQKRMVKKAFRKLEKLHKESKSSPGADEIDRMVQLILNQDHTIREQIQSMRQLDLEIEHCELQMKKEAESESSLAQACGQSLEAHSDQQLLEYLYTSDGVEQLELQVQRHQELILQLSRDIDAELRRANFPLSQYEDSEQEGAVAASWIPSEADDSFYTAELERLKDELKQSLFTGDQECWQLAAQLSSLQIEEGGEEEKSRVVPLKSAWVEDSEKKKNTYPACTFVYHMIVHLSISGQKLVAGSTGSEGSGVFVQRKSLRGRKYVGATRVCEPGFAYEARRTQCASVYERASCSFVTRLVCRSGHIQRFGFAFGELSDSFIADASQERVSSLSLTAAFQADSLQQGQRDPTLIIFSPSTAPPCWDIRARLQDEDNGSIHAGSFVISDQPNH
ncbi:hypothetical protein L3Q82_007162 [Scortum barcoo]|uniref:Uncharacterized protein n=1 Tax=Scortum barcoo TaxID=214431 RepID=A0ACB8WRZ8_9TELE|nr:hypothetical protein L3Q82_007162 [Scortum barcoo]